jgi:hypothetical protein
MEMANLIINAANLIVSILTLAAAIISTTYIIQDHRRGKRLQPEGSTMSQRSWKIPIALLLCAFILLVANVASHHFMQPAAVEDWNYPAGHHSGPLGPTLAAEFMWEFSKLPNCTVKVTAFDPEKSQLAITFTWLLMYGHTGGQAGRPICKVDTADPPPADPVQKNRIKGVVIHWNPDYPQGEGIAKWFDESGFIVSSSYQLPKGSPKNLIWVDIGPESPWK